MNKTIQSGDPCPCGSGKTYGECCAPIINGNAQSKTAEALMRARYTSYAVGTKEAIDFIISTCDKSKDIPDIDRKATEDWSRESTWHGLRVLRTEKGGEGDSEGVVEFEADYTLHGMRDKHHETAAFKKIDGKWLYETGALKTETVRRDGKKIGRNDPCPCGSGKKYKKCCGRGL